MIFKHEGKNLFSWTPGLSVLNPQAEEMVKTGYGRADIYESDGHLIFDIEAPGLKRGEIDIKIDNGYLLVSGSFNRREDLNYENYLRTEREEGEFQRTYPIPDQVDLNDTNKVFAKYEAGIISVKLPLKESIKGTDSHKIDIDIQ